MIRYVGLGANAGQVVDAEDVLDYAAARCGIRSIDPDAPEAEEFCRMFEGWFFSGGWKLEGAEDGNGA